MSAPGRGCVETRSSQGCAEWFSQLPSSYRGCQCNWLPHRRNRDGNSTCKLGVRVFTQPGSNSEVRPPERQVRSTPNNRPRRTAPACPGCAMKRLTHRSKWRRYSITSSASASKIGGMAISNARAVLRLMTRLNLVGCSTGISPGFTPCRILSVKSAARRN